MLTINSLGPSWEIITTCTGDWTRHFPYWRQKLYHWTTAVGYWLFDYETWHWAISIWTWKHYVAYSEHMCEPFTYIRSTSACIISFKWEGRVHAGNTTYTADSHPNSTKPRQENNRNVNGYKNTEDTQKQTNIYKGKYGSTALETGYLFNLL